MVPGDEIETKDGLAAGDLLWQRKPEMYITKKILSIGIPWLISSEND